MDLVDPGRTTHKTASRFITGQVELEFLSHSWVLGWTWGEWFDFAHHRSNRRPSNPVQQTCGPRDPPTGGEPRLDLSLLGLWTWGESDPRLRNANAAYCHYTTSPRVRDECCVMPFYYGPILGPQFYLRGTCECFLIP